MGSSNRLMAVARQPSRHPNFVTLVVAVAVSGLFSNACDQSEACQAQASLDGKTGTGRGPDEAAAKKQAIVDYCVRHDPTVDGKHRVWKAAGGKSSGDKAQDIENVSALKRIREQCEKRTLENTKAKVAADCKD